MAVVPEVFVRRLSLSSRHRHANRWIPFNRLVIGLMSVIVGISAVTGIVYFATRKYEWINVHLIPHTHDDVGWLKTPEEYFEDNVRFILNEVVKELQKDARRRFVYVETYFFWKWWNMQSEEMKMIVKNLVKSGQLEMIGGGWSMSDEAVVHYQSFIDQSTWGFRRINDTFGSDAQLNMAWQIDTFGHSKELAALFGLMGFDALFFARIDLDDRRYRRAKKLMEFIWEGNPSLGPAGEIFTSVFYDHYSSPRGFDFETEPVEYPIDVREFASYARDHAQAFGTNNILVPMGDDFRFYYAHNYFQKMDELIKAFNVNREFKLNVFYSTPSMYVRALRESGFMWPQYKGDFFPYGSELHTYWTGYYTSRPSLKYFERISNNFLQISKQLLVFAKLGYEFFNELTILREAMGVLQHHDAVTGTARQYVTDHYAELLSEGIDVCSEPVNKALKKLIGLSVKGEKVTYESCLLLNVSDCAVTTRSKHFIVTVYNPLSRPVDHYVRIPVGDAAYSVQTPEGDLLKTQLLKIPETVLCIPGRESSATYELMFKAVDIPAMGYKSYYVATPIKRRARRKTKKNRKNRRTEAKDAAVRISFDPKTNLLESVTINGKVLPIQQTMRYYVGSHHWTGAYIFRPEGEYALEMGSMGVQIAMLNEGEFVTEYEQVFSEWGSQVIRVYKKEEFVEFEWLVGPIPTSDYRGKEVVLVYSAAVDNGDIFYTDLNGRGMEKRVKNYREWGKKISEPVAGNFYPVTTQIAIRDSSTQLHIVTDRPEAGASLANGRIELMVHRRLCYDDGKGLNEALNEIAFDVGLVARGKHWLLFGDGQDPTFRQRAKLFAQERHSSPWLFFANAESISSYDWSHYRNQFSGLTQFVSPNIRILTLEPWTSSSQLLRLENVFEASDGYYSKCASVALKYLFNDFIIEEGRETTLGANKWLSEVRRMNWRGGIGDFHQGVPNDVLEGNMTVTVEPEHIRTFIIKMRPIK